MHSRKLLLSTLLSSLKDKDENIRAKAAEDIGKLEPAAVDAVNPLIAALKDKAPIVRYRSAEALEKIGTPKARRAVYKFRKKLGRDKRSW
ncbi:MAG: HEAT repeat domain-containing protein [Elusimicrobia bacterium]|nr:HEAT repeat domain-containing protein [Elusimicrobiota bacterium]